MSRKARSRPVTAVVVLVAVLIVAGTAFAARAKLTLAGPSGTLHKDQAFTVKASGSATKKANTLFAYEGGNIGGSTAAIKCYSSEKAENSHYKTSARVHVFLGSSAVHGHFSKSWSFSAANPGPRSFCAYLASTSGKKTFAHASLHWTNQ